MLIEIWKSSPIARILINLLGAVSAGVALYLLFIAYRNLMARFGRGKKTKITAKYATIFELKPPYAKGRVQFGFELLEPTEVTFSIIDDMDNVIEELHSGILNDGIHPFVFDTTKYRNGFYFYQYKSDLQNSIKKFAIDN
ncbi:MAG: hypothetical protein ACI8Q1_000528 [Parvicella sp.]|jgi:hypothetical protein